MGSLKKYYFAKQKIKPNTFIGGVSATINTPALVAALLGISASRIKSFAIVGSDIQFAVTGGNYNIKNSAFSNTASLTYFRDESGLVITLVSQCFRNCTNLQFVKFPSVTSIDSYVFENTGLNGTNDFPACTSIALNSFNSLDGLCTLNFPVLSTISGANNFTGATQDITVNVPIALKTSNAGKPNVYLTTSAIGRTLINYIGYTDDTTYNTEIGGTVGLSYITDKRTLAVKLALGSGGIDNYQNISGVIRFKATERYGFANGAFSSVNTITYYDDSIDGMASTVSSSAFNGSTIQWAKLYGITTVSPSDSGFRNNPNLTLIDMPNIQSFGSSYWGRNCPLLRSLSWPNLMYITNNSAFYADGNSIRDFYFPKLIQCGASTAQEFVFYLKYSGGTITVNVALQTCNAGAPDGDLTYAQTTRSTTIVYVP